LAPLPSLFCALRAVDSEIVRKKSHNPEIDLNVAAPEISEDDVAFHLRAHGIRVHIG